MTNSLSLDTLYAQFRRLLLRLEPRFGSKDLWLWAEGYLRVLMGRDERKNLCKLAEAVSDTRLVGQGSPNHAICRPPLIYPCKS